MGKLRGEGTKELALSLGALGVEWQYSSPLDLLSQYSAPYADVIQTFLFSQQSLLLIRVVSAFCSYPILDSTCSYMYIPLYLPQYLAILPKYSGSRTDLGALNVTVEMSRLRPR